MTMQPRARTAVFVVAVALAIAGTAGARQMPSPRDTANFERQRGTAIVRGSVTDAETGAPIPRVTVSLTMLGARAQVDTITDANGAFEFAGVPAGSYTLLADPIGRTTHRATGYGVIEGKPPGLHTTIVLDEGEVFDRAHIALARTYVIAARVVDAAGDPVADMLVEAEPFDGRGTAVRSRTTDDRGAVRLWGYSPGAYRVCAVPQHNVDRPSSDGYVRTCFPSAVSDAEAQPVPITSMDPPDVEIRLRRSRLFKISGVVIDGAGQMAASAVVSLVTVDRDGAASRSIRHDGGVFSVGGLPPGEYVIKAEAPYSERTDDRTREIGWGVASVQAADLEGLVVTMAAPAVVRGRVTFEGGAPPDLRSVTVGAWAGLRSVARFAARSIAPAPLNRDLTFTLAGLVGENTLAVNAPPGWIMKSVRYGGEERLGIPTQFRGGPNSPTVEIIMTRRSARLAARVLDARGQPVEAARVLLFPADRRQWQGTGPRSIWSIGASKEGYYEFGGVRAGEYFVAVIPDGMPFRDRDPLALEELSAHAERITLLEDDHRTIDLMVRD